MKIILASIGVLAIGATSIQAQGITAQEQTRPVRISAALRGFYDDNFTTLPGGRGQSSWGEEVSPSISYNYNANDITQIGVGYVYDVKHFEKQDNYDQSHQFNANLNHKFTELDRLNVQDSFVVSREPSVVEGGTFLRAKNSVVRNVGSIDYVKYFTPKFGAEASYKNSFYAYQDKGIASLSSRLDRIENRPGLDMMWQATPDTLLRLGYAFESREYQSDEAIQVGNPQTGSIRNSSSHIPQVGVDYSLTRQIKLSGRVGAQYVDYYNLHKSKWSPYADFSGEMTYAEGSTVQVGIKQIHSATDLIGDIANPVLDQDSTIPYISIRHKITSKLTVGAMGQLQYATLNKGGVGYTDRSEEYLYLNANLSYSFNENLTAETGYNYDNLTSKVTDPTLNRSYARNRVYVGVRASF